MIRDREEISSAVEQAVLAALWGTESLRRHFAPEGCTRAGLLAGLAVLADLVRADALRWEDGRFVLVDGPYPPLTDLVRTAFASVADTSRPRWGPVERKLWLGTHLVRRVARTATTLTIVLDAFEAAGWPQTIDTPLPQKVKKYGRKLLAAVRELNCGQQPARIQFDHDDSATKAVWRAA